MVEDDGTAQQESGRTPEQEAFAAAIRDFASRECGDTPTRQAQAEEGGGHHAGIYRKLAEQGWLGVGIPEQYGGAGGGMADACVLLQESGRGLLPVSGYVTTLIVASAYLRYGTEEQKQRVLGGIANGSVEAISMSEPEAGSDVAALRCRAERHGEGWVLNGQKTWCSHAQRADHVLLVARTDPDAGRHGGVTMFEVPTDAAGLTIRGIDTMAGREVNDLFLTDCVLGPEAVLGTVDDGWTQLMMGLNAERLIIGAFYLGIAERALDNTLDYVRQRQQFGRPVGRFQALRHRIADLATELACCRLLVSDLAARVDAHPDEVLPRQASMVKLKVTEVAKQAALEGMQMMGGYGYATEYEMERLLRTTVVSTVFGGTSEIQRDIIGKTYGL